jgi:Xaa-Pro dipeptidase
MNDERMKEFQIKIDRIYHLMDQKGYDAIVIGTQSNYSWLSCGGTSKVLLTSDIAVAYCVITKKNRFLVAYTMDGPRNIEEELEGMGFEPVFIRWYENSLEGKVLELVKGYKVLSDIPLEGAAVSMKEFYGLHYPLTEWEINRFRRIDQDAERLLKKAADYAKPGMLETEVESELISLFVKAGYFPIVVLLGSDERIMKYRHLIAKEKKIDKYLLLILVMRKFGLNAVLTRSVYFGDKLPDEIYRKFRAASTIAAHCIALTIPGVKFSTILEMQKKLYSDLGYPEEWKNHFQGGITGYVCNDSSLALDPDAIVVENQTCNWFITITGVNTEDTCISGKDRGEVLTHTGSWPLKEYSVGNQNIMMPDILYK